MEVPIRSGLFYEFPLSNVRLVDSKRFPLWRQCILSGLSDWFLACTTAEINCGHPQTGTIHQENTSATLGTVAENYIRLAASTVENSRNRLGQPQTMQEIRPEICQLHWETLCNTMFSSAFTASKTYLSRTVRIH